MSGAGDPPSLEQVRFMDDPSVATGVRGEMIGGPGRTNTVTETLTEEDLHNLLCLSVRLFTFRMRRPGPELVNSLYLFT